MGTGGGNDVGKLVAVQSSEAEKVIPCGNHRLCVYCRENALKFLVDCGADVSVIPPTRRQRLSGKCENYKLYAANGSEIETFGVKTLTLNLGLRRPYRWTFVIADVKQPILGADFLKYHRLMVDLSERRLIDKETKMVTIGSITIYNEPTINTVNTQHSFLDLLAEFPDITKPVSFNNLDRDDEHNETYHYIETTGPPVHAKARPLPPHRYHKVKQEFKLMQEMGICRPSKSEWASPLHVVEKKNGDIRPVGDYRRLNAITKPDRYPVPRLHDFTYILAGKKIFSKLDINKAYHHIRIAPEDVKKTAVITPFGLFEFLRLNFGLRTASQSFQRYMNNTVLEGLNFLFSFVDDVIIASDSMEDHKTHLREVFKRFAKFGITINLSKCEFGKESVEFLGYQVSAKGIKPLEHKIKAITEYPRPDTVEQLRRFLGMINFYRAGVPHAAEHQEQLNRYLKSAKKRDKTKIEWTSEAIQSFEQCKKDLENTVMLAHPISEAPISIMSDASDTSAGAVIQQWNEGKWQPLGYFSKRFSTAQQKYSTYDRELTAIFLAMKFFRHMYEGKKLTIFTDHKPLIFAFNKLETGNETPRRTRQLLYISEFTTDIRYVKADKNEVADALSRIETIQCPTSIDYAELIAAQENDDELLQLLNEVNNNISLKKVFMPDCNKSIYCENKFDTCRPYIPRDYRQIVFNSVHGLSHPGIRTTRKLMAKRFFWPGLNRDVGKWAKTCIQCQKSKVGRHTVSELQQFPIAERLTWVHIDIVGPLEICKHGHRYLVTMIDRFSRWPEAIPVTEITADTIAKVFYESWVCRFGNAFKLTTDQGRQFESKLFEQLLKLMGIKKIHTTPYHPQSNGMIERWHRSMKQAMMARLSENSVWCEELPTVLLGLRTAGRSDNGLSPAEYMYGQTIRLPGDFYENSDKKVSEGISFLEQLRYNIDKLKPVTRKSQNSRTLFIHNELGKCEYVFIRNDSVRKPLVPPYDGPYRVISRNGKVYTVQLPNRTVNISIDRLKPAFVINDDSGKLNNGYDVSPEKNVTVENKSSDVRDVKTTKSGRNVKPPIRFLC